MTVAVEIARSDRFPSRPRVGADRPAAGQPVPVHCFVQNFPLQQRRPSKRVAEAGGATDCCSRPSRLLPRVTRLNEVGRCGGLYQREDANSVRRGRQASLRPVRSGREPKGIFNRLPRFVAQNPGLPRGPCPAREYVRVPKWTSQWRFWNDRFPPIPLENSEIEPLRKSRFRAARHFSR